MSILYDIYEDLATDPVTYYPSVNIRSELDINAIGTLINAKQPTISPELAKNTLNELADIAAWALNNGNWIEIEDTLLVYTGFGEEEGSESISHPAHEIDTDSFQPLCAALETFEDSVESIAEFELFRYAFPKAPWIDDAIGGEFDYDRHVTDGHGLSLYGQDFGTDKDDPETGIWIESPAGNQYRQDRYISIEDGTIMLSVVLSGEAGPAGSNSVERIVTCRGKYDGGEAVIGNEYRVRATNPITPGEKEIFVKNEESEGPAIVAGGNVTGIARLFYSEGSMSLEKDGITGDETSISGEGRYIIESKDNWAEVYVKDYTVLNNAANLYDGSIQEVVNISEQIFVIHTENDGFSAFEISVIKTGDAVSWDMGNGDTVESDNTLSYLGYTGSSVKPVAMYSIDDPSTVTEIYLNQAILVGGVPSIRIFGNLEQFDCKTNSLSGPIPDLSNNNLLQYYNCSNNQITGSLPSLEGKSNLVTFVASNNQLTGYGGGLDSCTNLSYLLLHLNEISSEHISNIIDDAWTIRALLGANSCLFRFDGELNGTPDSDAIDKIEGTGPYSGDGLKDAGCTVIYNT